MSIFSGNVEVLRMSAPDETNSIVMPATARFFYMRNDGPVDVQFNFDDDAATDYYTLKNGERTEIMQCEGGQTIHLDGVGGSANIEMVIWG